MEIRNQQPLKKKKLTTELQPIGVTEANIRKEHRVKRRERKQSVSRVTSAPLLLLLR